ncbi:MAG: DUF1015 domain-containing protein [Acidobacteriaceae bacterium]
MARVYPFRALRYNPSRVRLEDVVTQPYDKITPGMQQRYYDRSPYNLVRIILGLPELFDNAENNVYTRAAANLAAWRANGVLALENEPAVFAYAQRYAVPGAQGLVRERRGFIALGELYDYAQKVVFRHEQTLAKPKSDRLNLLRATRAHCEQIYMLYSDPSHSTEKLLFPGGSVPDIEVADDYGVQHLLWKVSDTNTINMLCAAMADKKLIIADGHHRYETALAYRAEREQAGTEPRAHTRQRVQGQLPRPEFPEAAAMMTFVNMDSEGITILPTHRSVFALKNFAPDAFLKQAELFFTVRRLEAASSSRETGSSRMLSQLASAAADGASFIAAMKTGNCLLTIKAAAAEAALASLPPRQRKLDVAVLHTLVLERLLGLTPESIRQQANVHYWRDASEALSEVASDTADVAFLLNPVTLDQLREVAFAGEVMPQKSTDFYPKLLSGLTLYALD